MNVRRLVVSGLIGVAGLVTPLTAIGAHAHSTVCRSDPVVWLSNGHKVQLSSDISADPSTVSAVDYQLHIPAGVKVTKLVFTGGPIGRLEHIYVTANNKGGRDYKSVSTAHASQVVAADVRMQLVNQQTGWNETLTAQTTTNQPVSLEDANAQ